MDYQQLIDEIVGAVDQTELPLDQLRGMAQSYADACTEVNRRLARCGQYLRAGNTAEAIRLADTTPPLLDMCNTLDYSEREDWADLCKSLHLPTAPIIVRQNFEQLNKAYNLFVPMQELLRENRRLALERAPLRDRIAVLQKLNEMEPQNTIWSEMIAEFEKNRIEEIQSKFPEAQRQPNAYQIISALLAELESTDWIAPPPAKLVQDISSWIRKSKFNLAIAQFKNVAAALAKSVEDNNFEGAKAGLNQWNECFRTYKVPYANIPAEIRRHYEQAANWIKHIEQQREIDRRFEMKFCRFEMMLKANVGLDQLTDAYEALEDELIDANRTMPEHIKNEYQVRLDEYNKKVWHKQKIYLIGVAILVVFLIVIIGWFASQYRKYSNMNKRFNLITQYLNEYKDFVLTGYGEPDIIANAQLLLRELEQRYPDVKKDQKFLELEARTNELKVQNAKRQIKFEKAEEAAQTFITNFDTSKSEGNLPLPDFSTLTDAEENARGSEEKQRCKDLRDKFNQIFKANQEAYSRQIDKKFADLDAQLDRIRNDWRSTPEIRNNEARKAENEIGELDKYLKQLGTREDPAISKKMDGLTEKNKKIYDEIDAKLKFTEEVRPLIETVGNYNDFNDALIKYVKNNENSSISRNYNNIRNSLTGFLKIKNWNAFVIENQDLYLKYGNRPDISKDFQKSLEKFDDYNEMIPELHDVKKKIAYFDELVNQNGRKEIAANLRTFLKKYNKVPVWVCLQKTENKSNYYYFTNDNATGKKVSFGQNGRISADPYKQVLSDTELTRITPAPHYEAINKLLPDFEEKYCRNDEFLMNNWYADLEKILEYFNPYMESPQQEFDLLAKLFFYKQISAILNPDPICADVLRPGVNAVTTPVIKDIDWFDPNEYDIQSQRETARHYVKDLKPPQESIAFGSNFTNFNYLTPMSYTYEWIGFLRSDKHECSLLHNGNLNESSELYVCRQKEENEYELLKIGHCETGMIKFDESVIKKASGKEGEELCGLPVFIKKDTKSSQL